MPQTLRVGWRPVCGLCGAGAALGYNPGRQRAASWRGESAATTCFFSSASAQPTRSLSLFFLIYNIILPSGAADQCADRASSVERGYCFEALNTVFIPLSCLLVFTH
jgi:hypothetical protein